MDQAVPTTVVTQVATEILPMEAVPIEMALIMEISVDLADLVASVVLVRRTAEEEPRMQAARNFINSGHYQEACNVLNSIQERNARWYYYSAIANSGIGNQINALEYARKAVQMEPGNAEYRQLVSRLENNGRWYADRGTQYGFGTDGRSNCLSDLCCCMCAVKYVRRWLHAMLFLYLNIY